MKRTLLYSFILIGLTACTWVDLEPEAEKVVVLSSEEVKKCKLLGTSHVSVKYEVGGFARDVKTMTSELETLARNEATKLNGDAVVAVSEIEKGKQKYSVYRCRP